MALKDWKRSFPTTFGDSWFKGGTTVYLNDDQAIGSAHSGMWYVEIKGGRKQTSWFKKKPQALRFAKNYMRSH